MSCEPLARSLIREKLDMTTPAATASIASRTFRL
jgi:hypothetical protein